WSRLNGVAACRRGLSVLLAVPPGESPPRSACLRRRPRGGHPARSPAETAVRGEASARAPVESAPARVLATGARRGVLRANAEADAAHVGAGSLADSAARGHPRTEPRGLARTHESVTAPARSQPEGLGLLGV